MTAFDDRKTAAEAKFTHDQEFQFKTIARRNKLLGLWAAEQMGISGVDAEAYAKQVVIANFEEPGDADVLRKVLGDLTDKGIATDEHKVRHEMTRLARESQNAGFDRIERKRTGQGWHGTREEVIERYRNWLWSKMKSGGIPLADVAALNGKTLLCHCHPLPCHGDVLAKAASWADARLAADMSWQPGEKIEATIGPAPIYAGVGARKTPEPVLNVMRDTATSLAGRGWQLRTGGARGADDAFARAAPAARRTVYIPWRGYNGWTDSEGRALTAQELRSLQAAAAPHHPAWQRCPARVRDLHARNVAILIGHDMHKSVHAMVCWTDGGRVEGGTGMAICLARHYRIPIFNLATIDMRAAMDRLDRIAQTRDRGDRERELATSGGSEGESPSVTPARSQRDMRGEDWWMAEGAQQVRAEEPRKMTRQQSLHL